MRLFFIGLMAIITNSLFSQWNKVAKPYQDKMDYYSAAKAYSKVLDTGKIEDFIQYTRVLFNQGEYRKSYENYSLLGNKKLLKDHYDFQAFYTCMKIMDLPNAKNFEVDFLNDLKRLKVKGYATELANNYSNYAIQFACFNSEEFEDICPVAFEDGILFTSSRNSTNGELGHYPYNNQPFYDVFFVKGCEVQSIRGTLAKKLPADINTHLHDGPAYFASNSQMFFITRNIETNITTIPMGIFYSVNTINGWKKLMPLPVNNVNYTVQHPCYNDSTQTLYFSSNMAGGFGGFDIYSMKYLGNEKWSEPINLGPALNSDLNEVFPTMYRGNLYFASNGIKGAGGLDLYLYANNQIVNLVNLNSPWDDYALCFLNDTVGYLSSNRINGFGKDDILHFNLLKASNTIVATIANAETNSWGKSIKTAIGYKIVDSLTGALVGNPKVFISVLNKKSGIVSTFPLNRDSAEFLLGHFENDSLFDVNLNVEQTDYHPISLIYNSKHKNNLGKIDLGNIKMIRNNHYKTGPTLNSNVNGIAKYPQLKPIYFDLDKHFIRNDAALTLDSIVRLLNEYPEVKLEFRSFTDSRASDNYNRNLSDRRAKSTFNYLVNKGISNTRLIYVGFGESGLVNDCGDDKTCEEKMHQLNRRTEFRMID